MPDEPLSVKDFAARIKEQYPDYADADDYELTQRFVTKFPKRARELKPYSVAGAEQLIGTSPEMLRHWDTIYTEFEAQGVKPRIKSGFRTAKTQNDIHLGPRGKYTKGNDGYVKLSPHQDRDGTGGNALDVSFDDNQKALGQEILRRYADKFGLHVPADEPWHIAVPRNRAARVKPVFEDATVETPAPVAGSDGSRRLGAPPVPQIVLPDAQQGAESIGEPRLLARTGQSQPAAIGTTHPLPRGGTDLIEPITSQPLPDPVARAGGASSRLPKRLPPAPKPENVIVQQAIRNPEKLQADLLWHFGPTALDDFQRLNLNDKRKMALYASQAAARDEVKKERGETPTQNAEYQAKMRARISGLKNQPAQPARGEGMAVGELRRIDDKVVQEMQQPKFGMGDVKMAEDVADRQQRAIEQELNRSGPGLAPLRDRLLKRNLPEDVVGRVLMRGRPEEASVLDTPQERARIEGQREASQMIQERIAHQGPIAGVIAQQWPAFLGRVEEMAAKTIRMVETSARSRGGAHAFAKFTPPEPGFVNDVATYLEQRAEVHKAVGAYDPPQLDLPEKIARAIIRGGYNVGQIAATVEATGMSLPVVMVGESVIMNSDQDPQTQAQEAAKAYALGWALTKLPVMAQKGLGKVPGTVGRVVTAHPEATARTIGAATFGTLGAGEAKARGASNEEALIEGTSGAVIGAGLAGGGLKPIGKAALRPIAEPIVRHPNTPEWLRNRAADLTNVQKAVVVSEDGRAMSLYADAKTKGLGGTEISREQATAYGKDRPLVKATNAEFDVLRDAVKSKNPTPAEAQKQIGGAIESGPGPSGPAPAETPPAKLTRRERRGKQQEIRALRNEASRAWRAVPSEDSPQYEEMSERAWEVQQRANTADADLYFAMGGKYLPPELQDAGDEPRHNDYRAANYSRYFPELAEKYGLKPRETAAPETERSSVTETEGTTGQSVGRIEPKRIIRHSDPNIDGGEVLGVAPDGRLRIQNNSGGISHVLDPRKHGNREAAIITLPTSAPPEAAARTPEGEQIVEAAIKAPDGNIARGKNHPQILLSQGKAVPKDRSGPEYGFITSTGRFVSREDAAKIAGVPNTIKEGSLYTEDLTAARKAQEVPENDQQQSTGQLTPSSTPTPKAATVPALPSVSPAKASAPVVEGTAGGTIDQLAHEAAPSPTNNVPEPSQAQIEAGNYRKGHVAVAGMNLSIENPEGSERSGTDSNGKKWAIRLKSHYGYVRRTEGADGEHVDAYIRPGIAPDYSGPVFVVNQTKGNGHFDEHKAMIGWGTEQEAKAAYLENYTKGWDRIHSVATFESPEQFKQWVREGDTKAPALAAAAPPEAVAGPATPTATPVGHAVELIKAGGQRPAVVKALQEKYGLGSMAAENTEERARQSLQKKPVTPQVPVKGAGTAPSKPESAPEKPAASAAGESLARTPEKEETSAREAARTPPARVEPVAEVREPRKPKSAPVEGKTTRVKIPGTDRAYDARYSVREADDVVASHNPFNFQPQSDYHYQNDRRYDREAQYQTQVIARSKSGGAEAFDPAYVVNNSPTAESGPPIIDGDGNVLGGNSRSMIIKRVYGSDDRVAERQYRDALIEQASIFGIDPAKVRAMRQPVLVREIDDEKLMSNADMQKAITELNVPGTTPLTQEEQSAAAAGQISEGAAEFITDILEAEGEDATVASVMDRKGVAIINRLIEDGIFSPGDRNRLLKDGKPTPEAKARVESILVGSIYRDLDQMQTTPAGVRRNIERIVVPMRLVAGTDWDIAEDVKGAIDAVIEAKATGMGQNFEKLRIQTSMVREPFTDREIDLAHILVMGPLKTAKRFRGYAHDFNEAQIGTSLFGAPPSQAESADFHLGQREAKGALQHRADQLGFVEESLIQQEASAAPRFESPIVKQSSEQVQRIFGSAPSGRPLLDVIRERGTPDIRTLADTLEKYVGRLNEQEGQDFSRALDKLATLRATNTTIEDFLSQGSFFGKELTDEQEWLLRALDRPVRQGIKFIQRYVAQLAGRRLTQEEIIAATEPEPTPQGALFHHGTALRSHRLTAAAGVPISSMGRAARLQSHPDYKAAKAGDIDAAARVVTELVGAEELELAKRFSPDTIFVPIHAIEASGVNALPVVLAQHYANQAGAKVDDDIVQTNRTFHTGSNAMERMVSRPQFDGAVERGRSYVLVDDVVTLGGTLAEAAHYIQSNGGKVVGSIVLANASRTGTLAPAKRLTDELERRYGQDIRNIFGVEPAALTAAESNYLIGFKSPDTLRSRASAAVQENSRRQGHPSAQESPALTTAPAAALQKNRNVTMREMAHPAVKTSDLLGNLAQVYRNGTFYVNPHTLELLRRINQDIIGQFAQPSDGMFVDRDVLELFTGRLKRVAEKFPDRRQEVESVVTDLQRASRLSLREGGSGGVPIVGLFPGESPLHSRSVVQHEGSHEASEAGAAGRPFAERVDVDAIVAHPVSEKIFRALVVKFGYKAYNKPKLIEEAQAFLMSRAGVDELGLTVPEAKDWLRAYFGSFIERNGAEAVLRWRKVAPAARSVRDEVYRAALNTRTKGDSERAQPGVSRDVGKRGTKGDGSDAGSLLSSRPAKDRRVTDRPEFKRWFGESKVVDQSGQPLVVYHGTPSTDIKDFRKGSWFAENATHATGFFKGRRGDSRGRSTTYPVYLSVNNPLDLRTLKIDQSLTHKQFIEATGIPYEEFSAVAREFSQAELERMQKELPNMFWSVNDLGMVIGSVKDPLTDSEAERGFFNDNRLFSILDHPSVRHTLMQFGFDGLRAHEPGLLRQRGKKPIPIESDTWQVFEPRQIKSATGNRGTFDVDDPDILHHRLPVNTNQFDWDTGKAKRFRFIRNTERAPDMGERFQQHIEPAGRYVVESSASGLPEGWEQGELVFENPLVLDWGESYDETGWKHKLSQLYKGKTGKALSRAIVRDGHDGIVTIDKNGVSSEIVDLSGLMRERTTPKPRLSTLHNLHANQLAYADQIGGLAVPSIAVVPETMGLRGMGDITLIGTQSLGDPSAVPVHDADVWSATFPSPEYGKVPTAKVEALLAEMKPYEIKFNDRRTSDELWDNAVNNPNPDKVLNQFRNSNAVKAMFLKEVKGIDTKPRMRDKKVEFLWANDPEFKEVYNRTWPFFNDLGGGEWDRPDAVEKHKEITDAARAAIARFIDTPDAGRKSLEEAGYTRDEILNMQGRRWGMGQVDWVTNPTELMPYWTLSHELSQSITNAGKREIDPHATEDVLNKKLKKHQLEFAQWVDDKLMPMFGRPFIKTKEGRLPYSLPNIVDFMTGKVRAVQKHITFGEGKARAAAARQFNDLEQMRKYAVKQIAPESDIKEGRDESKKALEKIRLSIVSSYYGPDSDYRSQEFGRVWEGLDAYMRAMARWARGGKTEENFIRALSREGFRTRSLQSWDVEEAVEAAKVWLSAPVPYFEAKPQRAVDLSEFVGAVIPKNSKPETRELLAKLNIPFVEYNSRKEGAQEAAVIKFRDRLAREKAGVLFHKQPEGDQSELAHLFEDQQPVPPFYSKLYRAIEDRMPNKASVTQVRALINSPRAGVKADEVKWTGFDDWLSQRETATREEALAFLRANDVKVDVEVRGTTKGKDAAAGLAQRLTMVRVSDWIADHGGVLSALPGHDYIQEDDWLGFDGDPADDGTYVGSVEAQVSEASARQEIAIDSAATMDAEDDATDTKFEKWVVPGEARNYRELVFTLPFKLPEGRYEHQVRKDLVKLLSGDVPSTDRTEEQQERFNKATFDVDDMRRLSIHERDQTDPSIYMNPAEIANARRVREQLRSEGHGAIVDEYHASFEKNRVLDTQRKAAFKSKHWPDPNTLAHSRVDDRVTTDGKEVLLANDIQSDWMQKRREFEKSPLGKLTDFELEERKEALTGELRYVRDRMKTITERMDQEQSEISHSNARLHSIERGTEKMEPYETVAYHSGRVDTYRNVLEKSRKEWEQLNARNLVIVNDLRSIEKDKVPDAPFYKTWHELVFRHLLRHAAEGNYDYLGWATGDQAAEMFDLSKHIDALVYRRDGDEYLLKGEKDGKEVINQRVPKDKLADWVGKSVAQRIVNGEGHAPEVWANQDARVLDGLDLKVGSELHGMRGFYDKMISDYARKLARQWSAKVEDISIPVVDEHKHLYAVHGAGMGVAHQRWGVYKLAKAIDSDEEVEEGETTLVSKVYDSFDAAQAHADRLDREAHIGKVHAIEITPEMRKSVLFEGQPLFHRPPKPELPTPDSSFEKQFSTPEDDEIAGELELVPSEVSSRSPDLLLSDADPEEVHAMAMAGARMSMADVPEPGYENSRVSAMDVIRSFEGVLTKLNRPTPIRVGHMGQHRDARGFYKTHHEIIRLREANNIPTAAHEVGHAVHKVIYGDVRGRALKVPGPAKKELVALGKLLYGNRKPAGGYSSEGFAEFMRHYLTREDAATVAPQMHSFFESSVLKAHPLLAEGLQAARAKAEAYRMQGAENRALATTHGKPSLRERIDRARDAVNRLPTKMIEEFSPLLYLADAVEAVHGPMTASENPYLAASYLRGISSVRVAYMVEDGMVDFASNKVGKPLADAAAIVKGQKRDFTTYLRARRSRERWLHTKEVTDAEGNVSVVPDPKDPGMTLDDANHLIAQLGTPEFELAAQQVYDWNAGVLAYVKEAVPSLAPAVDKILASSQDYVPLARVFEKDEVKKSKVESAGGNPLKRMKGSGREVKDIFPQMIANATRMLAQAHRKFVLDAIVRLAGKEGVGHLIEELPKDQVPHSVSTEEIIERLTKAGVDIDVSKANLDELMTFFSPTYFPKGQEPIVPYMRDGKMRWYRVDPDLYNTLMGLEIYRLPKVLDLIFGVPTRIFRAGTTGLRPAFSLFTNPARDVQTFIMQTQSNKNPALLAAIWTRSMAAAFSPLRLAGKRNEYLDLFFRLGAQLGQPLGIDMAITHKTAKRLFRGKIINTVTSPLNLLQEVLSLPESASRVAELMAIANEVGWKPGDQMTVDQEFTMGLAAKRVTTDFSAGGGIGKIINQASPFFNAGVQGGRSFARTMRDHPKRSVLRGILLIAIPTLLLWWKIKDEDWYIDMPWRDKFLNWHIPFGDQIIEIPRAFEWGNLYGVIPEAIFDSWYRKDPEGLKAATGHVFETTVPDPMPIVARNAKEQWQNRIAFFDRPIVPRGELDLPPGEQRSPYTSKVAVWLGKRFPDTVSPRRVDALIRGFGGGVAPDVLSMVGLGGARGVREKEPSDLPVIGRAFRRGGKEGLGSKAVDEFYNDLQRVRARSASSDRPETTDQREYRLILEDSYGAIGILREVQQEIPSLAGRQQVSQITREIAVTARDRNLTPEQRVDKLGAILARYPALTSKVEEKVTQKKEQARDERNARPKERERFTLPGTTTPRAIGGGPPMPRPPTP